MESLRTDIELLRSQLDTQGPTDVYEVNSKVDEYNALVRRQRSQLATYNINVDVYNGLLRNDKTLVAQYNALLR